MSENGRGGRSGPHLFTVDVEEYFHVHAFDGWIDQADWKALPRRVESSTRRVLRLLDDAGASATFFVLGWVAERTPDLVREIAAAGHEVASHGWWHRKVTEVTAEEFRSDVRSTKRLLEDIVGAPVLGYRAPGFSLFEETRWMLEILAEEGYRYDSSLFPSWRAAGAGYPGAERRPHLVPTEAGDLLEVPAATIRVFGLSLPAAGGAYLRHLPYSLIRTGLRQAEEEGGAGVFYVHPWEIDPHQPRLAATPVSWLRHYGRLERTEERLRRLTSEFRFTSIREYYEMDGSSEDADVPDGQQSTGVQ